MTTYIRDELLVCPTPDCENQFIHIDSAFILRGRTDGGIVLGTVVGHSGEERDCVELSCRCEAGHYFKLRLQQRKGRTSLSHRVTS